MKKMKNLSSFIFLLSALLLGYSGHLRADELTIANGTATSQYLPIYGYYVDTRNTRMQFIYPASDLNDMKDGTIERMTFYANKKTSWGSAVRFRVQISEIEATTLTTTITSPTPAFTEICTANLGVNDSKELVINFPTPYEYGGGNLLIDITVTTIGTCSGSGEILFYGKATSSNTGIYRGYTTQFLPKTTFTYTSAAQSCYKPVSLASSSVTDETATVSWAKDARQTDLTPTWQYICKTNATAPTAGEWASATSTSATSVALSDLSPATTYTFFLRADCGEDDYSQVVSTSFTTDCGIIKALPYDYDFTGTNSTMPQCWTKLRTADEIYDVSIYNNQLRFSGNSTYTDRKVVVILPPFQTDIKNLKISFDYSNSGSYSSFPEYQVGYTTSTTDPSKFMVLHHLTRSTTTVSSGLLSLANATSGSRIAICYTKTVGSGSTSGYAYIDNLHIEAVSNCRSPQDLTATEVLANAASFAWTAGGDETSWQYLCLPAATTPSSSDWNSATTVTSLEASISTLTANTAYKFYVRACCSANDHSDAVSVAFTTPCTAVSLPLSQNFNSIATGIGVSNIPSCWTRISHVTGDYTVPCVTTGGRSGTSDNALWFYGGGSNSESTIILRPIDAATNTLTISFWYKNTQTGSSYGQAKIGYITDPEDATTFHVLKSLSIVTDWTHVTEYALTGASPSSFIAIQLSGGSSGFQALYIDDLVVSSATSCVTPSGLTASAASATSANLSWTKGGDETAWKVRYSTEGETWTVANSGSSLSSPSVTVAGSSVSYTLTGLEENTTYYIQVQADCGSSQSGWTPSAEVTTPCAPQTGNGWSDDFESAAAGNYKIPDCYASLSGAKYPMYPCVYEFGSNAHGGSKSLQFYGGGTNSEEIIILPEFTEVTSSLYLTLWYKNYDTSSSYPQLQVGYITDPTNASTFNAVANGTLTRVTSYTEATVPLTGATSGSRIAIRYTGGGANEDWTYIDDISLSTTPPCYTPGAITKSGMTANSVTLSWAANGATGWNIQTKQDGGSWSASTHLASPTYNMTGLTSGVTYHYQVQADCGGEWVSGSYTPVCPTITGITLTNQTAEGVTVNWTISGSSSTYNLRYRVGTILPWNTINDISGTSQAISGLSPEFTYNIEVQASCSDDWVATTYQPVILPPTPAVTAYDGSANVVWNSVLFASGYQYVVVLKDATHNWNNATFVESSPTAGNPVVLSGLAANTQYDLYVRTTYGSLHTIHSVERKQTFTTTTIAPISLTNTAVTASTATFTWNKGANSSATQFQWACKQGSAVPTASDWQTLTSGVLTTTVENLPASTTHTFYVRAYYTVDVQSAYTSLSFTTECEDFSLPFSENFSSWTTTAPGPCWTSARWSDNSGNWYYNETNNCIQYKATSVSATAADITTPPIILSEPAELTFRYSNHYSSHAVPSYVIISNGINTETVNLETTTSSDMDSRYVSSPINLTDVNGIDFTNSIVTITFRGAGSSGNSTSYFRVDDVKVESKVYIFTNGISGNGDHQWSTASNWNKNRLPKIDDFVILRASSVINSTTTAKAKSVMIDRIDENTGSIEIQPKGELIIAETLRQETGEIGNVVVGPTSEEYLSISTSAVGNGVLAIGTHDGTNRATVNFYTKACKTDADGYVNQFIGTPFYPGNDVYADYYGSYIYKHNAVSGAWDNVKRGNASVAFAGYNILRKDAEPATMWMQGTLCASDNNKVLTLTKNAGDVATANVIANSWMAPISIAAMSGAFTDCEETIYLFNAGSKKNNTDAGGSGSFNGSTAAQDNVSPGQFISVPVNSAQWISGLVIKVIPSMQGFIVKATGENPSVTLNYSTMVLNPLKSMENATATAATRAPRRNNEVFTAEKPDIMSLSIVGEQGGADVVYLLMREDFTTGYENGYDGYKMMGGAGIPQLYALSEAGNMSVNCIADAEGTIIAFEPRMEDMFQMTFSYDGAQTLYLNDIQAHTSTLISEGGVYLFNATEEDDVNRFFISATPIAQVTTEVADNKQGIEIRKVIIDNHLYIIRGGQLFDALGKAVK